MLLTTSEEPEPRIDGYLAGRADDEVAVYAVGGPAVRAYPEAEAVYGENREETAVVTAQTFFDDPDVVGIARSYDFPDALTGGAHVSRLGGPVLLTRTTSLRAAPSAYLCGGDFDEVFVYGGTDAIAESTFTAIADRVAGEGVRRRGEADGRRTRQISRVGLSSPWPELTVGQPGTGARSGALPAWRLVAAAITARTSLSMSNG